MQTEAEHEHEHGHEPDRGVRDQQGRVEDSTDVPHRPRRSPTAADQPETENRRDLHRADPGGGGEHQDGEGERRQQPGDGGQPRDGHQQRGRRHERQGRRQDGDRPEQDQASGRDRARPARPRRPGRHRDRRRRRPGHRHQRCDQQEAASPRVPPNAAASADEAECRPADRTARTTGATERPRRAGRRLGNAAGGASSLCTGDWRRRLGVLTGSGSQTMLQRGDVHVRRDARPARGTASQVLLERGAGQRDSRAPARYAASSISSACHMPVMCHSSGEVESQVGLRPVQPCLHRVRRDAEQLRGLPRGEPVEHGGLHDRPHLRRQPRQRRARSPYSTPSSTSLLGARLGPRAARRPRSGHATSDLRGRPRAAGDTSRRIAMPHSHAATSPSPRHRSAPFQTATKVSWSTSATAPGCCSAGQPEPRATGRAGS